MKSVLIASSILIMLLAALRPLLRGKIDPRLQYALWLVVALRLLIPVELADSAYSVPALLDRAERPAQVAQAIGQTHIPTQSYGSAWDQALREYEQSNGPITTDGGYEGLQAYEQVEYRAQALMRGPTLAQLFGQYARPVWLGGAVLMAAWFLLVNLRLRRKLAPAQLIAVEESRGLPVFVSDALPSPCLCGVLRPAVYVTPHAAADPDRLRHVLAHEAAHHRHRDHWWALVRCLCLCLYWFDPLVWWAAALSRQDCELACDAGAIRRLGEEERLPYGRTLVDMIAAGRCSLLQTATTMTGSKRRVRERVRLIARKPKTVIAVALALALVLGAAVGCTFTGAPEKDPVPTGLSADSLRERLMDVPEELKPTVTASASETKAGINDIALVSYWWDVPAEWESEQSSWLLDVHRLERSLIDGRGWPQISDEPTQIIAQDEEFYYVLEWPGNPRFQMADSEPFTAAYQAIRAFAEQQVLRTEGLEPYVSPLDTLQARLMDVPEDLRADVEAIRGSDPTVLAEYWLDRPYTDYQEGWGWLLTVYQWDQAQFEEYYSDVPGTWHCFAKDDTYYYVTARATDVRVPANEQMVAQMPGATEVETKYLETFEAIKAFAEKTVLETEGVEPYDPSAQPLDTLQQRLMDVPEEWRDKFFPPEDILDPGCLTYYCLNDPKWQDLFTGWVLSLYRLDQDLVQHNLDQQLWPSTGIDIFARSGDQYYVILWAGDGRYQDTELGEEYWAAVSAMKDHVRSTVLATEGVEPFDPYTTPPHFFSNVPQLPLEPGGYAIDGMNYTLVTSHEQVPEDPEQWYLVGQMDGSPVWMFTRGHGVETMFQIENRLTKVFPYTARFFGGGQTPDGHAPRLMPLEGFAGGPKGTFDPFAVITHVFQGGTDQQYQLTVYDLGTDPAVKAAYVHDWRALMEDFNDNSVSVVHEDTHSVTVTYQGTSAEIQIDDIFWDNVQQYGFSAETYEYCMNYYFNDDGTFDLAMPVNSFTTDCIAVWTFRFTGSGFENVGFRFDQTDDAYTYISTVH